MEIVCLLLSAATAAAVAWQSNRQSKFNDAVVEVLKLHNETFKHLNKPTEDCDDGIRDEEVVETMQSVYK